MDLDMLKAVTDDTAAAHDPLEDGRWDEAEAAVSNVLGVLRRYREYSIPSEEIYDAIKSAYVGSAVWGDDEATNHENGGQS